MGSFRPAAGNQHLHWYCNFAGPPIETAPKSLLHSCRSELTRQGISLTFFRRFHAGADSIFIRLHRIVHVSNRLRLAKRKQRNVIAFACFAPLRMRGV
jgi:hypothetical protein